MRKKGIALVLALVLLLSLVPLPAVAADSNSGTCGDDLYWSFDEATGTLTITGTGDMEDFTDYDSVPWRGVRSGILTVALPEGLTSIGDYAFYECENLTAIEIPFGVTNIGDLAINHCAGLTSIEIPASVTSIGHAAFYACDNLASVMLSEGLTSIGATAFSECSSLTVIEIPASVILIADNSFSNCFKLTAINVSPDNPNYSSDDRGVLFDKHKNVLIEAPGAINGSYTVPDSVTSIGAGAFFACESLTSIEIPVGVTSVGVAAFHGCSSLTVIEIPASVTSIGMLAFMDCSVLTDITILSQNVEIGMEALGFTERFEAGKHKLVDGVTIHGYAGSTAEAYAKENNIHFVALDLGDVTGDGVVDNKDLTRLFQHLSGWEAETFGGLDMNGDGAVDNKDLTRLFQHLSGWDVEIG